MFRYNQEKSVLVFTSGKTITYTFPLPVAPTTNHPTSSINISDLEETLLTSRTKFTSITTTAMPQATSKEVPQDFFNFPYSLENCSYLLLLRNQSLPDNKDKFINVIFNNTNSQAFKTQIKLLLLLSRQTNSPIIFIANEPKKENHFLCGIVSNNKLLIINPLGRSEYNKFCLVLLDELKTEISKLYGINLSIFLSEEKLQNEWYELHINSIHKLVSSGLIATEVAITILSTITYDLIDKFFDDNSKTKPQNTNPITNTNLCLGLEYYPVKLSTLLPDLCKMLLSSRMDYHKEIPYTQQTYREIIINIRNNQNKLLQQAQFKLPPDPFQEYFNTLSNTVSIDPVQFNRLVTQAFQKIGEYIPETGETIVYRPRAKYVV